MADYVAAINIAARPNMWPRATVKQPAADLIISYSARLKSVLIDSTQN